MICNGRPIPFFFALLLLPFAASTTDLYKLLNVQKSASIAEIKRAYRNKARATHPDKQKGVDSELAAIVFREIVEAYEILSDPSSRKHYDRTGQKSNAPQKQDSRKPWHWSWTSGGGADPRQPKHHKFLFDPVRRVHIRDAQSRVIHIRNLEHLLAVIVDQEVSEDREDFVTERYTFLAFIDSKVKDCVRTLNDDVLFPWPFAGYNYEGTGGMWWEEIIVNGLVDISGGTNTGAMDLSDYFGVLDKNGEEPALRCPTIVIVPRNLHASRINKDHAVLYEPQTAEAFMQWIWPQLKMNVYFENKTPWTVHVYWLDGNIGKKQPDIAAGSTYFINTFISHSFYMRASFVEGYSLTNEVVTKN